MMAPSNGLPHFGNLLSSYINLARESFSNCTMYYIHCMGHKLYMYLPQVFHLHSATSPPTQVTPTLALMLILSPLFNWWKRITDNCSRYEELNLRPSGVCLTISPWKVSGQNERDVMESHHQTCYRNLLSSYIFLARESSSNCTTYYIHCMGHIVHVHATVKNWPDIFWRNSV